MNVIKVNNLCSVGFQKDFLSLRSSQIFFCPHITQGKYAVAEIPYLYFQGAVTKAPSLLDPRGKLRLLKHKVTKTLQATELVRAGT